ncbi:arginine deiminase family protein [Proteiniphilum sp. X52]|uniref:arginine deiminase n=1 Tax=Proteiniphilum sp. X52 TaxID=2382159 RepID=UPI000F0A9748|nr:arginine deiminase family protein [Proteiniphilum sp. X52]RNC66823.1 arginine deiminase [Proteiniphilum sp. X52]
MTENKKCTLQVQSETGKLEAVLIHYPGAEVENMTPRHAQRALYSDILNLSIARREYNQLLAVLKKISDVYEVADLLEKVLEHEPLKEDLIRKICAREQATNYIDYLMDLSALHLTKVLIEGLPLQINTLTDFLREEYYALKPLYNYYFTRDPSAVIGNNALVCKMANSVRIRESLIMDAIFKSDLFFSGNIVNSYELSQNDPLVKMEGGDILVVRDDILLIGNGMRTSAQGIDFLVRQFCKTGSGKKHVIVQQLPESPESFIHLDMVFTMLDNDKAMVYKPLIMDDSPYQTVHMQIDNGKVTKISSVGGILSVLRKLGIDLMPIVCGGKSDDWDQEREQWHSGANFLALAPGKVISYARNIHTLEELNKNGFEVVKAADIINGQRDIVSLGNCVITLEGSELPRGGGGPRCMTMPLRRTTEYL